MFAWKVAFIVLAVYHFRSTSIFQGVCFFALKVLTNFNTLCSYPSKGYSVFSNLLFIFQRPTPIGFNISVLILSRVGWVDMNWIHFSKQALRGKIKWQVNTRWVVNCSACSSCTGLFWPSTNLDSLCFQSGGKHPSCGTIPTHSPAGLLVVFTPLHRIYLLSHLFI